MPARELKGHGASDGIFAGPLVWIGRDIANRRGNGSPPEEIEALETAITIAIEDLAALKAKSRGEAADMLDFQIALLEDETLRVPAIEAIYLGIPADQAWLKALDAEIAGYETSEDEYFRARCADLRDIRDRVIRALTGSDDPPVPSGAILAGEDMPPSLFLQVDWSKGGAIILARGSPTSHVAMLARSRGVPMVVGLGPIGLSYISDAIVDGHEGIVVLDPTPEHRNHFQIRSEAVNAHRQTETQLLFEPARLKDGSPVDVLVNLASVEELDHLDPRCCGGIGLMRTEFLFHDGAPLPGEEAQYLAYKRFVQWADGRPVTIRTLDVGGDKPVTRLTPEGEGNPFLGLRGVRLTLQHRDVFRTQLRALARAAVHGDLKIMIPMVTIPAELAETASLLDGCVQELVAAQIPCRRPALGIMVEVPAAAITPGLFRGAAFMSIGSNDLTQYVTAAARDSAAVMALANPAHPAVLQLIAHVVRYGREANVPVSLCGDMAGEPDHLPALIKAGLRTLSVAPARVARVKAALAKL